MNWYKNFWYFNIFSFRLSIRIPAVKDGIHKEEFLKFQDTLLSSFNLDSGYPDRFLQYVTEIKYIIRRQNVKDDSNKAQEDLSQELQKVMVHDNKKNKNDADQAMECTSDQAENHKSTFLDDLD